VVTPLLPTTHNRMRKNWRLL